MLSHPLLLVGFAIVVIIMLLLDLGIFNKKGHVISNKEAIVWSVVWIALSMIFSVVIYFSFGYENGVNVGLEKFSQFQSAYWIEKSLSVDNLFVFIMVFSFFKVPKENQHKILFWGIIGALILRAIFIFAGIGLIKLTYLPDMVIGGWNFVLEHANGVAIDYDAKQFYKPNVVLTIFGFFLVYAGFKTWLTSSNDDEEKDFTKSAGSRLVHKFFKVSKNFDGDKFFTVQDGVKMATPMLVVIAVIEFTDLIFAVDSVPAIFAIAPDDPFILYTSNIFAILGLRALFFILANFIYMFSKLQYGLAIILVFIGLKMVISPFYDIDALHSLIVVALVLIGSVILSVLTSNKEDTVNK